MARTNVSNIYYNNTTVSIPANSDAVRIVVHGARGGNGGKTGGSGGAGRYGEFTFKTNYTARSLGIVIGGNGGDGSLSGGGAGGANGGFGGGGSGGGGSFTYSVPFSCPQALGYSGIYWWTSILSPQASPYTWVTGCNQACKNRFGRSDAYCDYCGFVQFGQDACSPPCKGAGGPPPDGKTAVSECFGCKYPQTCFNTVTDNAGGGGGGGGATGVSGLIVAGGGGGGKGSGGNGTAAGSWQTITSSSGSGANGSGATSSTSGGTGGGGAGTPAGGAGAGGGSWYDSNQLNLVSNTTVSGTPYVQVSYQLVTPEITYFRYTPSPQDSGTDGVPDSTVTLEWATRDATSVSINQGIGTVAATGSRSENTGLQSVAGSTSPATRSYTLTACAGTTCITQSITVQVYNDNTPNNYTVPNVTNAEPNTAQIITVGVINGIDMATAVNGGPGVDCAVNDFSFANNKIIRNGDTLRVRAFSLPFNTSPDGLTNSIQYYVDVGTVRRFFTITTRAPRVNEVFDYPNEDQAYPFPKLDTTADSPTQFIESDLLTLDDVELSNPNGVEIKTNNGNAQVRIKRLGQTNFGNWTDIRSI